MKEIEFLYLGNGWMVVLIIGMVMTIVLGYKKKNNLIQKFRRTYSRGRQRVKIAFMVLGLLSILVALLGPSQEDGIEEVSTEGLDIYVLIDTSKSMLSEDVRPSRFELAKSLLSSVIDQLNGDRIGFIPFSSTAYVQMPLTDDYDLANMFLQVMDTDMISGGGSDLAEAIEVAMTAFDGSSQGDQVILILSDGEDHESQARDISQSISSEKIKIYAIGLGTAEGGLIPEYDGETKELIGYKKTNDGQAVMSKLDASMLMTLASATGGQYYQGQAMVGHTESLLNDMVMLNRGQGVSRSVPYYQHYYQYFLGLGLLLFIGGYLLPERSYNHV